MWAGVSCTQLILRDIGSRSTTDAPSLFTAIGGQVRQVLCTACGTHSPGDIPFGARVVPVRSESL